MAEPGEQASNLPPPTPIQGRRDTPAVAGGARLRGVEIIQKKSGAPEFLAGLSAPATPCTGEGDTYPFDLLTRKTTPGAPDRLALLRSRAH